MSTKYALIAAIIITSGIRAESLAEQAALRSEAVESPAAQQVLISGEARAEELKAADREYVTADVALVLKMNRLKEELQTEQNPDKIDSLRSRIAETQAALDNLNSWERNLPTR